MPNAVVVAIILFLLAASFRISFFFYIAYFFALTSVLARLWIWWAWRRLEVRREFDDHVFLEERVVLRLRLINRGRLPLPWVRVQDRLPGRLATRPTFRAVVSLLPREARMLEYDLVARRRGYYPIGPLRVDLGDVFGFYQRHLETTAASYLTVYPKILTLEQLGLPSKSPFGSLRTQETIYEDPARIGGVRDYTRGDSLRKINWKASAAVGRLQVKKLEPAITLDTVIFLNLNVEEYELAYADGATELAITVAASVANHLAGLRQPIGLISNGRDLAAQDVEADSRDADAAPRGLSAPQPWETERRGVDELGFAVPGSRAPREWPSIAIPPGKGRSHLIRVLEALARAQARAGQPLASMLRQQAVRLPWGSTLIVVTWGRAMGLVEALVALRRAGFNVVVVLVRFGIRDIFPAQLASMGIQVHEVRSEQDATLIDQVKVAV
jgi:uncharacterized protein (DUF58 family)